MASQVTSGYSTEGTQYAQNNSFYLLDTVPGSGSAIPGPVTITGNLTVTGTTTLQGAAGATSLNTNSITAGPAAATYAASGNLAITSATQLSLQAPVVGATATAGALNLASVGAGSIVMNPAAGGSVGVTSVGALTVTSQGTGAQQYNSGGSFNVSAQGSVGIGSAAAITLNATTQATVNGPDQAALVCQTKSIIVSNDAQATINGFGAKVQTTRLFLERGLALNPSQGTFQVAAAAFIGPAVPGLGNQFTWPMIGNKTIVSTYGPCYTLEVTFPATASETQWVATYGQVGTTGTGVLAVEQFGNRIVFYGSPLATVTVWVCVV